MCMYCPHGKVERKARLILDSSVFRAVYQIIPAVVVSQAWEDWEYRCSCLTVAQ